MLSRDTAAHLEPRPSWPRNLFENNPPWILTQQLRRKTKWLCWLGGGVPVRFYHLFITEKFDERWSGFRRHINNGVEALGEIDMDPLYVYWEHNWTLVWQAGAIKVGWGRTAYAWDYQQPGPLWTAGGTHPLLQLSRMLYVQSAIDDLISAGPGAVEPWGGGATPLKVHFRVSPATVKEMDQMEK